MTVRGDVSTLHESTRRAVRVLLVGTGTMGKIRAALMYANPKFDLCGICDTVDFAAAEELATLYSTEAFHNLDEAIARFDVKEIHEQPSGMNNTNQSQQQRRDRSSLDVASCITTPSLASFSSDSGASLFSHSSCLDGIVIAVRTNFHAPFIEQAARCGLPIFVEKPVAETPEEIERLFDVCQQSNVPLCCGFQRRFDDSYVAAAEAVRAGRIGKPLSAHIFFGDSPCPPLDFLLTGGNIFYDLSIHDVDYIRWALDDDIESVNATATFSSKELEKHGVHDNATLLMKTTKGTLVTLTLSRWSCYGYDQHCEIFGEKGMVSVNSEHKNSTVVWNQSGEHHSRLMQSYPERYQNAFANEIDAFANAILSDIPWVVTKKDAIEVQKVAQAAKEASELHCEVRL